MTHIREASAKARLSLWAKSRALQRRFITFSPPSSLARHIHRFTFSRARSGALGCCCFFFAARITRRTLSLGSRGERIFLIISNGFRNSDFSSERVPAAAGRFLLRAFLELFCAEVFASEQASALVIYFVFFFQQQCERWILESDVITGLNCEAFARNDLITVPRAM